MATNSAINSTNPIGVASGGSGRASLTASSVLVGATTSPITQVGPGTNGQTLIGSTGADPAWASLTSTASSITYTTGSNTLNLDIVNWAGTTSWTPTLSFGGASVGITYVARPGNYTRVGNIVFYSFSITLSNKGSSTGDMSISGLPVSAISGGNFPGDISISNLTFLGELFVEVVNSTSTLIFSNAVTTGSVATLTDTAFANNTVLVATGFYFV